jgi:hypothetical protein
VMVSFQTIYLLSESTNMFKMRGILTTMPDSVFSADDVGVYSAQADGRKVRQFGRLRNSRQIARSA